MYRSLEEICKEAAATGCSFWELIQKDDCRERQIAQEESFVQLQRMYQAMKEADQDYDGTLHSRSGLVGTDGGKLEHYVEQEEPICGDFLGRVMEKAVKMGESNACMKRIVAAPTAHAAAMALKNLLGLVCDPVAGLVEVPCVKRNVSGAVVALSAADMALAGVRSRIPPDEVIDAMREVGISMPACLRETGEGGLAATPEGIKMRDRIMD